MKGTQITHTNTFYNRTIQLVLPLLVGSSTQTSVHSTLRNVIVLVYFQV